MFTFCNVPRIRLWPLKYYDKNTDASCNARINVHSSAQPASNKPQLLPHKTEGNKTTPSLFRLLQQQLLCTFQRKRKVSRHVTPSVTAIKQPTFTWIPSWALKPLLPGAIAFMLWKWRQIEALWIVKSTFRKASKIWKRNGNTNGSISSFHVARARKNLALWARYVKVERSVLMYGQQFWQLICTSPGFSADPLPPAQTPRDLPQIRGHQLPAMQ